MDVTPPLLRRTEVQRTPLFASFVPGPLNSDKPYKQPVGHLLLTDPRDKQPCQHLLKEPRQASLSATCLQRKNDIEPLVRYPACISKGLVPVPYIQWHGPDRTAGVNNLLPSTYVSRY